MKDNITENFNKLFWHIFMKKKSSIGYCFRFMSVIRIQLILGNNFSFQKY